MPGHETDPSVEDVAARFDAAKKELDEIADLTRERQLHEDEALRIGVALQERLKGQGYEFVHNIDPDYVALMTYQEALPRQRRQVFGDFTGWVEDEEPVDVQFPAHFPATCLRGERWGVYAENGDIRYRIDTAEPAPNFTVVSKKDLAAVFEEFGELTAAESSAE